MEHIGEYQNDTPKGAVKKAVNDVTSCMANKNGDVVVNDSDLSGDYTVTTTDNQFFNVEVKGSINE